MIEYKCGHCRAEMESPDVMKGKVEVCPSCGARNCVPSKAGYYSLAAGTKNPFDPFEAIKAIEAAGEEAAKKRHGKVDPKVVAKLQAQLDEANKARDEAVAKLEEQERQRAMVKADAELSKEVAERAKKEKADMEDIAKVEYMTIDKAKRIFIVWKEYIAIAEKLRVLFTVVPESFLPYPADILEEALNIVAKEFFDAGDKRMANDIQETMCFHLIPYHIRPSDGNHLTDDETLARMKLSFDMILNDPKLKMHAIHNLKSIQDSWIQSRERTQ